jgi:colanic acid biosynthesis glycosyl transferase WcaI
MKKRLLVVSQVYVPDPTSLGQHVADAAEEMARRGWEVSVLAANRGYEDASRRYADREVRGGVSIRRLSFSSMGKKTILHRLGGQLSFCLQAAVRGLLGQRPDLVLVSTSPPMAPIVGVLLSRLRGIPFVWWAMDINPDQAVISGQARAGSVPVRLLEVLIRSVLRRARAVVALDRFMAARLEAKVPEVRGRMHTMPPWPHETFLGEAARLENPFRKEQGFGAKFVVMYSGNHSLVHPLETLLAAAERLRDEEGFLFVFVGGGAGKARIEELVRTGKYPNVVSLPYQPMENLKHSLSAADVHAVTMGNDMVGVVHPCKFYGAMAIGKPVICFAPRESHLGELIEETGCGWRFDHGDVDGVVAKLRELSGAVFGKAEHPRDSAEAKGETNVWPREGTRSEEQCGNREKRKGGPAADSGWRMADGGSQRSEDGCQRSDGTEGANALDSDLLQEVGRRGLEAVRGKYGEQELRRRFCDVLEGAAGPPVAAQ